MNRAALAALALVIAAAFAWLIWSGGDDSRDAKGADAGQAKGPAVAPKRPLPPLPDASIEDAAPTIDAALTLEHMRRSGVMGRPPAIAREYIGTEDWWKPVPDAPIPTFRSTRGVTLRLIVEKDRVVRARADFPADSLSVDAMSLSTTLVGQTTGLPTGFEAGDEADEHEFEGTFEPDDQRKLYYRCTLRREGELPRGPAVFEIGTRPLPPRGE